MKKILGLILLVSAFQAEAASHEYITNGGFEAGNFTGWNVTTNNPFSNWVINNGSVVPVFGIPHTPISGAFDALATQSGSSIHSLFQTFTLDTTFSSAIFSWSDRIYNTNVTGQGYVDPTQEFRAVVYNSVGTLISSAFSTNPGDALTQNGPNNRSFDLTSILLGYAGQSIRVGFENSVNLYFMPVYLDNVSFRTTSNLVPEPASLALLGLGFAGMRLIRRKAT